MLLQCIRKFHIEFNCRIIRSTREEPVYLLILLVKTTSRFIWVNRVNPLDSTVHCQKLICVQRQLPRLSCLVDALDPFRNLASALGGSGPLKGGRVWRQVNFNA
jgi:hypothetical protein